MTRTLSRIVLASLLVPLAGSTELPAQVKEPPRAEKVDVQIRYRIRADRDERVRQYRALEKHLAGLGFVDADKDKEDRDLDILDPNAERFNGTLPGAKVLDILNDERVQNILFAPSGFQYPDAPEKPVAIRIGLRTGLTRLVQQQLHTQVVAHLGKLGFVEALGYDTKGYTIVRGAIPYKSLELLVKDIRSEPSGWLFAETPPGQLPSPLRDRNPLRWTEVLPITEFAPPFVPIAVLPAQFKYSADLRAALGDPAKRDQPIRAEVLFQNRLTDLEALRALIQGRYPGASLDGIVGNVASIRFPRTAMLELVADEPSVIGVRLPRQATETISAAPAGKGVSIVEAIKVAGLDQLHVRGYTGAPGRLPAGNPGDPPLYLPRAKVILIASDFTGVEKHFTQQQFESGQIKLVDLTTELTSNLVPEPAEPSRVGTTGTLAARALAAVAPDAELILVRIDPGCYFHLYAITRLARGEIQYTDALQVRIAELASLTAVFEREKQIAVDAYKAAFSAPAGNPAALAARKQAEDDLVKFLEKEKDAAKKEAKREEFRAFSSRSDTEIAVLEAKKKLDAYFVKEKELNTQVNRFNAYQRQLQELAGAHVIVNTLVWESGYPLDGLSDFAGTLDALAAPKPPRVVKVATPRREPLVWVQAASAAGAAVWGGPFADANRDGLMEFVPYGQKLSADSWSPQLNFLGTRSATGEVSPDIAKDAKLRFVVQWREPADPNFPGSEIPAYPLTFRLLRQLDPTGEKRSSDEMLEVARSVSVPNVIFRTGTYLVYEQMLEYTVPDVGRYALALESPQLSQPLLPALRREFDIHPRIVIETVGAPAGDPRAVFRSFTSFTAGVGTPGDALGAITIGTGATGSQVGGGTGVGLRVKPNVLGPEAFAFGPQSYTGEGMAAAFAGGAAALLVQARATGPNVFASSGIGPGKPLALPPEWLKLVPRVEKLKR